MPPTPFHPFASPSLPFHNRTVFVPVTLSVFSVILFLRLGFVVGQAGFYGSIGMFIGAYLVVGLTILSISAISTNGIVHGGGAYYMIR